MEEGVKVAKIIWERLDAQGKRLGELSERLAILTEQLSYQKEVSAGITQEISAIREKISELKQIAQDNQEFILREQGARERRAEKLLDNSYSVVFNWISAAVAAIAVAGMTWLLSHRPPRIDSPPPAKIEQGE